jgi:tRNA dimethylallyltransferase
MTKKTDYSEEPKSPQRQSVKAEAERASECASESASERSSQVHQRALPVVALVGATAAGKTATSVAFAERLATSARWHELVEQLSRRLEEHPEEHPKEHKAVPCKRAIENVVQVISADSRQVYRMLDVGTAKPSPQILATVPHHCISIKAPVEAYSAGLFGAEAMAIVDDLHRKSILPLVVGGSGLYVQALCEGLFEDVVAVDTTTARAHLERRLADEGIALLYHELRHVDPVLAERYNDLNPRRIIRALEYFYTTGIPLSKAHQRFRTARDFATLYIGVYVERDELYHRINRRAVEMFGYDDERGIVGETVAALQSGCPPFVNALNTVGYKECIAYLQGSISRQQAVELTQQNTRRYAKRQMTWFRRNASIHWLTGSPEAIAEAMVELVCSAVTHFSIAVRA